MSILAERTIAITGAGSGIGRALALTLAERGATLALADKDEAGLAETSRLLGNRPHFFESFDVSDEARMKAWIDRAASEFGGLDGIINNAGLTVIAPFADTPAADFDRVMDVNFGGVLNGCRHALPHLKRSKQAWIVNISSVFGLMGFPTQSAYNASKFAVRGLTEALQLELAGSDPHITVTRVHPGGVKTNVAKNAKYIRDMDGDGDSVMMAGNFEKAARSTPMQAAETIVRGMEKHKRRVLIGPDARLIDWLVRLLPVSHSRVLGALLRRSA